MAKKPTQTNKKAHKTHVNKGADKTKSKVCPSCGYRYTPQPGQQGHGFVCPGAY